MYDLNKRSYFTTLGELRMLLAHLPAETKVCTGGVLGSYLHFAEDGSLVSFDDDDLYDEYSGWSPTDDEKFDAFWQGQDDLMMMEHNHRIDYLADMQPRRIEQDNYFAKCC